MRIAVNTRFLIKGKLEGIGWFTHEILREMVMAHPEDEFLFLFDRKFDPTFIFAKNVKPIVIGPPARHPYLWYIWFQISLKRKLKQLKPDVFLSPDGYLPLGLKVPNLLVVHDLAFEHFSENIPKLVKKYYKYFTPKFCQSATHINTVSNYTKKDVVLQYQIKGDKISVSGNAARAIFKPISSREKSLVQEKYAEGKPYFLYVGAVHPRKNVHRLIQAFDSFKVQTNSEMKLLIGGRFAWKTGAVKSAFEEAKNKEDIKFLGYLDTLELPKITAASEAMVYVSLFEGFGIPLLEAMQCDVPVITSNVTSMPEVVGEAGIVVNPLKVIEISKAMELVLDKTRRVEMINAGRKRTEIYTWKKMAAIVYSDLKGLV